MGELQMPTPDPARESAQAISQKIVAARRALIEQLERNFYLETCGRISNADRVKLDAQAWANFTIEGRRLSVDRMVAEAVIAERSHARA
jgi:hypothetical protein